MKFILDIYLMNFTIIKLQVLLFKNTHLFMFSSINSLKSKADIMQFAILISTDSYYDVSAGKMVNKINLEEAEKVYQMFERFDIPDYEKPITDDIVKSVVDIMKKEKAED